MLRTYRWVGARTTYLGARKNVPSSKRLFDVIYQFSLRKHSAKAVSSGFLIKTVENVIFHKIIQDLSTEYFNECKR